MNQENLWWRQCNGVTLTVCKTDSLTGEGLPGAVFELIDRCGPVDRATTDYTGTIRFCVLPCGTYTLREVSPPPGYRASQNGISICVDACGCIYVEGRLSGRVVIANTSALASFTAIKVNIQNGMPLAGAEYTLFSGTSDVMRAVSSNTGALVFSDIPPGLYELAETAPPPGFQPNAERFTVIVTPEGGVTIGGEPANGYRLADIPLGNFSFAKVGRPDGRPLAGAEFELSRDGVIVATAISNAEGVVNFGIPAAGSFLLRETSAPEGYLPNDRNYLVEVGDRGAITVDGLPLAGFMAENIPFTAFSFIKAGQGTGLPLAGAAFELRQDGELVASSTSDPRGLVSFSGLAPGLYQLSETLPPAGYRADPAIYRVEVPDAGEVTINGLPVSQFRLENIPAFQSLPPAVDIIFEGDSTIGGSGVAGCTVTAVLPGGSAAVAVVGGDGIWSLPVPPQMTLSAGDRVEAYQTCAGMLPSETVETIVVQLVTLSVLYNPNGGTGGFLEEGLREGTAYAIKTIEQTGTTPPAGFMFVNWNTLTNGAGDTYMPEDIIFIARDLFLYAQWVPAIEAIEP